MTDKQIIKALECCNDNYSCPIDCPLYEDDRDCLLALNKPVLDLINRQKAEIEELRAINESLKTDRPLLVKIARTEAVKEFAKKLRVTADEEWYTLGDDDEYHMEEIVRMHFIDEIEKEMVGDG